MEICLKNKSDENFKFNQSILEIKKEKFIYSLKYFKISNMS